MCLLLTDVSAGSSSQELVTIHTRDPHDAQSVSAVKDECDTDVTSVAIPLPNSATCLGNGFSGVETSMSDTTALGTDCNRIIAVSGASELDECLRSSNSASVPNSASRCFGTAASDGEMSDDASRWIGSGSGGETSYSAPVSINVSRCVVTTEQISIDATLSDRARTVGGAISDGETPIPYTSDAGKDVAANNGAIVAVAEGGTVSTNVSGETDCTSSGNTEKLPALCVVSVATGCDGEIRCVRCRKVQPPQCCPVCKRMFASLPDHIGTHSGKNPYIISSLLGLRTTYDGEDSERGGSGGGGQVEGDGTLMATVPRRPRKHKRHRVPQQCTVCGRTYTKLTEHMARMHGTGDPCMCTICGKFLRNANTLRAHMLSGTCVKSRVCPICERTCENDAGLKSHLRSHASVDRSGDYAQAVEATKDHHCNECGHAFSSSEALEAHAALHSTGKHHDCCICGRTFIHARSLRLHIRMHTGETPFECKAKFDSD